MMLKGIFKNIISISMAFLVLFSTMSFTINEHYCGGDLQDTSFFVKAATCGMEMDVKASIEGCVTVKDNCCNEVVKIVQGQEELQVNYTNLAFQQQFFLTSFHHSYLDLFSNVESKLVASSTYIPPLIVRDIQLLDDVFLI